jgi:hypothetical protein
MDYMLWVYIPDFSRAIHLGTAGFEALLVATLSRGAGRAAIRKVPKGAVGPGEPTAMPLAVLRLDGSE